MKIINMYVFHSHQGLHDIDDQQFSTHIQMEQLQRDMTIFKLSYTKKIASLMDLKMKPTNIGQARRCIEHLVEGGRYGIEDDKA